MKSLNRKNYYFEISKEDFKFLKENLTKDAYKEFKKNFNVVLAYVKKCLKTCASSRDIKSTNVNYWTELDGCEITHVTVFNWDEKTEEDYFYDRVETPKDFEKSYLYCQKVLDKFSILEKETENDLDENENE